MWQSVTPTITLHNVIDQCRLRIIDKKTWKSLIIGSHNVPSYNSIVQNNMFEIEMCKV